MVLREKKIVPNQLGRSMRRKRELLVWFVGVLLLLVGAHLLIGRSWLPSIFDFHRERPDDNAGQLAYQQAKVEVVPAYSAGTYMAGRRPENISACRWNYGLPHILAYSPTKIIQSPKTFERSPYRVLPYIIRGHKWNQQQQELPPLTLCTHATADQVYAIVDLVRRWEGPLSLAIFTPGLDAGLAVAFLDRACRCEPAMFKVSVHFVFPMDFSLLLGQTSLLQDDDCTASDLQWRKAETERKRNNLEYPINVARNVARMQACTFRVVVSDIELLPSRNLATGFLEMVRGRLPRIGVAFVVPVFEIESGEEPPSTKYELLRAVRAGRAFYFHRFLCSHCQRFPGLVRWMVSPDPGRVRPLVVTRREFPHHRWEPVFIGTRQDPFYTENMSWEGRQDKMAQMFEMCLLNYRLVVLDGAFLVHTPGIKRRTLTGRSEKFVRLCERRNARIYQNVIRHLLKQYPSNGRCRR